MNTTIAASQANVTVATIRAWCRMGAVAAVKVGRRWAIEAKSLAKRIAMTAKPKTPSVDTVVAIGGSRWTKNSMDRVYLNGWARFISLEVSCYNTGNISAAWLNGEDISNSEAGRLLGAVDKVYFDAADDKLHIKWGYSSPRSMDRDDIARAIFSGIRAEIAAL